MTDWPEVTMADVLADQQFFADHPDRLYRSRPCIDGRVWIVCRDGHAVFLRTLAQSLKGYPDTDAALRRLWAETARVRRR